MHSGRPCSKNALLAMDADTIDRSKANRCRFAAFGQVESKRSTSGHGAGQSSAR